MSALMIHRAPGDQSQHIALPEPRGGPINIRPAVLFPGSGADIMFIDQLQKQHSKMVGFMPRMQLEAYIKGGHVLVAESSPSLLGRGSGGGSSAANHDASSVIEGFTHPPAPSLKGGGVNPLGYCIFQDKYLKREELGIVYHLNVVPGRRRGLVGASLVKAAFERSAYGCKLFCCWCAQDLEANHFWESIGFVPLAFRTGSRKAGSKKEPRIHIFWQRRIREGDDGPPTGTPYWFPSETTGGAMREARIVLPIPPGTHWSDAKPAVLPAIAPLLEAGPVAEEEAGNKPRRTKVKPPPVTRPRRGLWFAPPAPTPEEKKAAKAKEPKARPRMKNDPKLVAAARELRDKYLEQVNAPEGSLQLASAGKYDVSRQLEEAPSAMKVAPAAAMLEAA